MPIFLNIHNVAIKSTDAYTTFFIFIKQQLNKNYDWLRYFHTIPTNYQIQMKTWTDGCVIE